MHHNENHIQTPSLQKHRLILKTKWETLSTEERVPYDKQARDHLARQGVISESVADAMRKDKGGSCSRSFLSVQQATGDWCGKNTIVNWLKSQPDFCLYTKRIRPGLTEQNRLKQIAFSEHVHNRWGLPSNQRILWTMSDEKWWFGLVARTFAKMCPALGIAKEVFAVHHKKHISKVMAHATVGYCFTGNPENGGEGLLLGLNRCQAFKVAQKSYKGKGGIRINKGDCLLTDCNVTGTDTGTPVKPKFALRNLWEYGLLPSLDALVAVGGLCAGAIVVHQEDNAGSDPIPLKAHSLHHTYALTLHVPICFPEFCHKAHIKKAGTTHG